CKLIHPHIQFLIGDMLDLLALVFRDKMDCCFVLVLGQMPVYTIVACIDLSSDKPLETWRVTGIEGCMPILVPGQQIGIFLKTVWKVLQCKPVVNSLIRHVRLSNKFC